MYSHLNRLLEPINIGKVEIKNRLAMAPMGVVGLLNPDGTPGQRAIDYYIERVRGGVGLVITGLFKVESDIEKWKSTPPSITPRARTPFAELAETVHAFGGRIFVQLTAGFGRVLNPRNLVEEPVSASAIPYFWQPDITCRELATGEVERLVACFGTAAEILASAGIDGIELHGHEGYLFDQFTTPIWNRRTDKYGGDLEGKLRFPIEVLEAIKQRVGEDFPVQYRFGLKHYMKGLNQGALPGEEFLEAGRDIEEGIEMAKSLEQAGFDALHVDAGCYDSHYWSHPPVYQEHGCTVGMAEEVKKVVKIPVIAVGKLDKPDLAQKMLDEGKADIIAVGRGLLADPYWMQKVEEDKPDRIRPCIGCHDGCLGRIMTGGPLSCAVNPKVGREMAYALKRTHEPKKVMIVGGGVAGLEASRTAALRGHQVTLYERSTVLGGSLIPAGIPSFKKDLRALLDWYESEIGALDVEVKMGHEVNSQWVETEKPQVVIIASGAMPIIPSLPGMQEEIIVTAPEVLLGTRATGRKVLGVGGGLIGCETAVWLAQQGKSVTLIERLPDLLSGGVTVPKVTGEMLQDMLRFNGVEVMTGTRLTGLAGDSVHFQGPSGEEEMLNADTVVLSLGRLPDKELYRSLVGRRPGLYLIGDAREARNIMGAVWDAYEVARSI